MNNADLLKELIVETRNATLAYYNYMYTDREYVKGQKLYLREMHFLLYVGANSELTMSEIAEKMGVTQGAATQIANRLIKKDLICKKKHFSDKRFSVIALTDTGKEAYENYLEYDKIRSADVAACLDSFSKEDIQIILRYERMIQDICSGKSAGSTRIEEK